jgi:thiamine biosynthesis lipoprotein
MNKIFISFFCLALIVGCQEPSDSVVEESNQNIVVKQLEFYGNTQGTTYAIMCNDDIDLSYSEITEKLHQFDLALSAYIPNSILSKLNDRSAGKFVYRDSFNYFNRCLEHARYVYELTNGAFDPSVYPLVDGWGFMNDVTKFPDSLTVDSLRSLVGYSNGHHFNFHPSKSDSTLENSLIIKNTPNSKLDFNAIAQGLSVDVICEMLDAKMAKNYFVEIGGEIRVKGLNAQGKLWSIGIDKPIENSAGNQRELQEIIALDNKAVATSGSYRKFYEKNGVKYSHTLDPKTGFPVTHSLLSATVVAPNCTLADGLATGFMVMGPEKSILFLKKNKLKDVEAYFIFYNSKGRIETYQTKGFRKLLIGK